jgi:hypothetical protein
MPPLLSVPESEQGAFFGVGLGGRVYYKRPFSGPGELMPCPLERT